MDLHVGEPTSKCLRKALNFELLEMRAFLKVLPCERLAVIDASVSPLVVWIGFPHLKSKHKVKRVLLHPSNSSPGYILPNSTLFNN